MIISYYPNDLSAIVIIANPKNSDVSTILSNLSMILVYYDVNVSCMYLWRATKRKVFFHTTAVVRAWIISPNSVLLSSFPIDTQALLVG